MLLNSFNSDSFDMEKYFNRRTKRKLLPQEKEFLSALAEQRYMRFRQDMINLNEKYEKRLNKINPKWRQHQIEYEEIERQEEPQKYQAERANLLNTIKLFLRHGETITSISEILYHPVEEITVFVKEIEEKDRENNTLNDKPKNGMEGKTV